MGRACSVGGLALEGSTLGQFDSPVCGTRDEGGMTRGLFGDATPVEI